MVFEKGIRLFNAGSFWDAHESWEDVWRRREEESRIFFQGIIQAAAGFHLITERPRPGGAAKNLEKALEKLALFPDQFLGLEVGMLRDSLRKTLKALEQAEGREAELKNVEIVIVRKPARPAERE